MKKKMMSLLLTIMMVISILPIMSRTAHADGAYAYYVVTGNEEELEDKVVRFNNMPWYIIKDESTALNAGTVTLLAQGVIHKTSFGDNNRYSESDVKSYLDRLTKYEYEQFYNVADEIVTVKVKGSDSDSEVDAKLWLLSTEEASNVPENVRKVNTDTNWWLRSPGNDGKAAYVDGGSGNVSSDGADVDDGESCGVRPALKLDLSKVTFDSDTKTFSTKPAGYNVTINAGDNMTKTDTSGAASQTDVSGAITPVVYTANDGYYFPTDYSVAEVNGISVTRNSDTQITVSGTPTADAEITLTAPTANETPQTAYADYVVNDSDDNETLENKVVHFNNVDWYILEDNSTAVDAGTVTLFATAPISTSKFDNTGTVPGDNHYSNSKVRLYLDSLTSTGGSFENVADAIVTIDSITTKAYNSTNIYDTVENAKLYLLDTTEADSLPTKVLRCNSWWWLRSPADVQGNWLRAAAVDLSEINRDGGSFVNSDHGVRPALKLDLSKVIFDSDTKTFSMKPAGYNVTINAGDNMTKTDTSGEASQTDVSGAIDDVVYTANQGYYFPTDYSVADVNGISVTRDSYKQITVSGTPTADAEITLTAPTAIGTPTVSWDGKTVSWTAVDGATGYKVEAWTNSKGTYFTETVSAETLEYDVTDEVNDAGDGRHRANVYAIVGEEVGDRSGWKDQYFRKVEVSVAYKSYPYEDYYEVGTTGGTVSVTTSTGETLAGPDTNGTYSGLVSQGAETTDTGALVTVTATPATGYHLEMITESNTKVSDTSPYAFNVKNANYYIDVRFLQDQPDPITLTLKWSSIDGQTKLDDKEIELDPGQSFWEALSYQERQALYDEYAAVEGYSPLGSGSLWLTPDPITSYSSDMEAWDADISNDDLNEDTTVYVLMAMPVKTISLSVEKPLCGDEVEYKSEGGEPTQSNAPVITVKDDSQMELVEGELSSLWIEGKEPFPMPLGVDEKVVLQGGTSYIAMANLMPKFGYAIDEDNLPEFTVENADEGSTEISRYGYFFFNVTADHDWDEGEITKEPTTEAEGEMTYKCKHFETCGGTKTEPIDKLIETVTLTLYPSSREDEVITEDFNGDPVEPIVIEVPKGTTMLNALKSYNSSWNAGTCPWATGSGTSTGSTIPGYMTHGRVIAGNLSVPFTEVSNGTEFIAARNAINSDAPLEKDTAIYVPMDKCFLSLTIETPVCGKPISNGEPAPVITLDDDSSGYRLSSAQWCRDANTPTRWTGTVKGDTKYYAYVWFNWDYGYSLVYNTQGTITVNGGDEACTKVHQVNISSQSGGIIVSATAEHDWEDEGEVTTEPTVDAEGVMTYKCKHYETCGGTKTESIPKLTPVTLTLHFSSLDGDDLVEPIVIKDITPGTKLRSAIEQATGKDYWDEFFIKEGYIDIAYRTLEPLNNYADWDEYSDAYLSRDTVINDDMDVYVGMGKEIDAVEITIAPPICGVETNTPYVDEYGGYWKWSEQTNKPEFSVPSGKNYQADSNDYNTNWRDMEDDYKPFVGTFEGEKTYKAECGLKANFGYCFAGDDNIWEYIGTATVNGGSFVETWWEYEYLSIIATVTADHDWVDVKVTKEPTCLEPGEKELACNHNDEDWHTEDASKTEEIAALGHDWSEWVVTKEPTVEAEGEEKRTCSRCDESETRAIPKIDPEEINYRNTEGDGSSWQKGSGKTLEFIFKRSTDDSVTFSHFTGIQVDGKDVAADNYTAKSGSVIVTLKPSFLETLSVGQHTLTAKFNDGNNVTVKFYITEKKKSDTTPTYIIPKTGVE